jgi:hypothetical protein
LNRARAVRDEIGLADPAVLVPGGVQFIVADVLKGEQGVIRT